MSSISLSLKMMLAASACAGLTLIACGGEDSGGGGDDDDKAGSKGDAGSKRDAGRDSGTRDAGLKPVTPGDECDPEAYRGLGGPCEADACDSPPCISQCVDGVYDECKSASDLLGSLADSGIFGNRDGGAQIPGLGDASITRTDGGVQVMFGDASINIPATECPDNVECSEGSTGVVQGIISQFTGGIPYCADPASGLPPACTDNADCQTQGFKAATCLDSMFLGKFCVQTCK